MVTSYIHEKVMNCLVTTDLWLPEHAHHLLKILKPRIYIYNLSISVPLISTLRIDQRFSMDCPCSMDWSSDPQLADETERTSCLGRGDLANRWLRTTGLWMAYFQTISKLNQMQSMSMSCHVDLHINNLSMFMYILASSCLLLVRHLFWICLIHVSYLTPWFLGHR